MNFVGFLLFIFFELADYRELLLNIVEQSGASTPYKRWSK